MGIYNNTEHVSDYQLDMVYHGLAQLPDVNVQFLPEPYWMRKSFKDRNPEQIRRIWGKGYTVYGLMDDPAPGWDIDDSDLVIVGKHHTLHLDRLGLHNAVQDLVNKIGKEKVCVVDGHDGPEFLNETADLCNYFKRELVADDTKALPIFFAVPEEKFHHGPVEKRHDFAPMVPANYSWENCRHTESYVYDTEDSYYEQYQQSFFGYSCKKAGWATGRQNEIIINKCIPFITDIEICPKYCLFNYPKELCLQAKRLKGVCPGTYGPYSPENTYIGDTRNIKCGEDRGFIDWGIFDLTEYNQLQKAFFDYAWQNLTTKALAKYILEMNF